MSAKGEGARVPAGLTAVGEPAMSPPATPASPVIPPLPVPVSPTPPAMTA